MTTTDQQKGGATNETSRLKAFNERLKSIFFPGVKFTEEEEMIMKIIYKLLDAPGTVKITPREGPYYLVNANLHYSLYVDYGEVKVVNTVDSLKTSINQQVTEAMRQAIDKSVMQDANLAKASMFDNSISILTKVEEKLSKV